MTISDASGDRESQATRPSAASWSIWNYQEVRSEREEEVPASERQEDVRERSGLAELGSWSRVKIHPTQSEMVQGLECDGFGELWFAELAALYWDLEASGLCNSAYSTDRYSSHNQSHTYKYNRPLQNTQHCTVTYRWIAQPLSLAYLIPVLCLRWRDNEIATGVIRAALSRAVSDQLQEQPGLRLDRE